MKVTLRDIAARTGYSVNTVSHALSGKTDISEATREEITRVAAEMGYIRNSAASGLRSGRSRTIALILPDAANPHFIIVFRGIEAFFRQRGYTVFVLNTDEDPHIEAAAIRAALAQNADGILLCPAIGGEQNIAYLSRTGVPFCLIGRRAPGDKADFVVCDDEEGGYLAAAHLLAQGHRHIAFLNGDSRISTAGQRLAGCRRAMAEKSLFLPDDHVLQLSVKAGQNRTRMRTFFKSTPNITALVAFSDLLAFEAVCVLEEMGLHVPSDLSIVGFDNICSDFPLSPPLSSISVSKKAMATASAEILWERIEGRVPLEHTVVLPTKLIQRKTVLPIKE